MRVFTYTHHGVSGAGQLRYLHIHIMELAELVNEGIYIYTSWS